MTTGGAKQDRRGRCIWWAVLVFIVLALVVLAAGQASAVYYGGRRARDVADLAAYSGLGALALELRQPAAKEDQIVADMRRFVTLHRDLDSVDLLGYYLDASGKRLGTVGEGIPEEAHGLHVIVNARVPTLLTRLLGLKGWPVERQAQFSLLPK